MPLPLRSAGTHPRGSCSTLPPRILLGLIAFSLVLLGGSLFEVERARAEVAAPAPARVDQRDPRKVVGALFDVAQNGNWAALAGLCDPQGQGDGDTRRMCALAQNANDRAEFRRYFSSGRVAGPPRVWGDRAEVPILFGPRGQQRESIRLIRRGRLWYLHSL